MNACFGSQEGTLAPDFVTQVGSLSYFNQPRRQFVVICQPRGHFNALFGSQEGASACVLAPKRALQHAFWLPRGHFSMRFGTQEGTLVCIFQQLGHWWPFLATNKLRGLTRRSPLFLTSQCTLGSVVIRLHWRASGPCCDCSAT